MPNIIKYKKNFFLKFWEKISTRIFKHRKNKQEKFELRDEENSNKKNEFINRLRKINNSNDVYSINSQELSKALTEVKVILSGYNYEIIEKIPTTFINFIEREYDKNYFPNINVMEDINKQELMRTTRTILAIIYRKYLANINEDER